MNGGRDLVFFIYARKSSESEDRQIQSIEDQLTNLRRLADEHGLNVREVFIESRSAKAPEARPIFQDMLDRITKGEANAILCWQINRLSRNPIDSGRISWLLQRGVLRGIRTVEREYTPDDNVLLLSVETGMANQYILDLSRNVKRGMYGKLERGEWPALAPVGYLNDPISRAIVPDPQCFAFVKRAWRLMLTGHYTVAEIRRQLNGEGFRTRVRRRSGGRALSHGSLYSIFTNSFYAGIMKFAGTDYPGKHVPMVSMSGFRHVQALLGRTDQRRPRKHFASFNGVFRCGYCGCSITAERHTKRNKATGKSRLYVYYRCTHKKPRLRCTERQYLSEPDLERLIEKEIARFSIRQSFFDVGMKAARAQIAQSQLNGDERRDTVHRAISDVEKQLANLVRMRYQELVSENDFLSERSLLQSRLAELNLQLREHGGGVEGWLRATEDVFSFLLDLNVKAIEGDSETKRRLFEQLGSNREIINASVALTPHPWLELVLSSEGVPSQKYGTLEPTHSPANTTQNDAFASLSSDWWTLGVAIANRIQEALRKGLLNSEGTLTPLAIKTAEEESTRSRRHAMLAARRRKNQTGNIAQAA